MVCKDKYDNSQSKRSAKCVVDRKDKYDISQTRRSAKCVVGKKEKYDNIQIFVGNRNEKKYIIITNAESQCVVYWKGPKI